MTALLQRACAACAWLALNAATAMGQGPVCLADSLTKAAFPDHAALLAELSTTAMASQHRPRGGAPVVPVVVHVVWNTAAENIADAVIQAFVEQMDQDFNLLNPNAGTVRPAFADVVADVGIRFCLAQLDPAGNPTTGITRTYTTETWFDPNTEAHKMKEPPFGISAWDPTRYLNIWVCDIVGSSGSIVSGYTYLPIGGMAGSWQDGLVIDYYYGTQPSARTPTHEAGHYFGLRHTFDGNSCFTDDGFADTPNTNSPTWNCNNPGLIKCNQLTQYENYMDYSGCTAMFTLEQAAYMNGVLNGVRSSLLSATACATWSSAGPAQAAPRFTLRLEQGGDRAFIRAQQPIVARYELLDAAGRNLLHGRMEGPEHSLDLSRLPNGVFWLRLTGAGFSEALPLVLAP